MFNSSSSSKAFSFDSLATPLGRTLENPIADDEESRKKTFIDDGESSQGTSNPLSNLNFNNFNRNRLMEFALSSDKKDYSISQAPGSRPNRDLLDFYPPGSGRSDFSNCTGSKENKALSSNNFSSSKVNIFDYVNGGSQAHQALIPHHKDLTTHVTEMTLNSISESSPFKINQDISNIDLSTKNYQQPPIFPGGYANQSQLRDLRGF